MIPGHANDCLCTRCWAPIYVATRRDEPVDWLSEAVCFSLGLLGAWSAIAATVALWCAADEAMAWWLR